MRRLAGPARVVSQIDEVDCLHNQASIPAACGYRLRGEQKIAAMQRAIGVDLGGSHVSAAVVTEDGTIQRQHEEDLEDLRFEAVVAALDTTIGLALKDAGNVVGIGIGSPGNIDGATGAVLYSPNFGWENAPLGETLRKKFGMPVFVANDARCATLGEYTFGTGKLTKDFVLLTLGTGIGGGIVARRRARARTQVGGRRDRAPTRFARPDGFICSCGKTGCFEAQASGTGLIRHAFQSRILVSAQRAARRRARQAQFEEDPARRAGGRRPRARRVEKLHRRSGDRACQTSSPSSIPRRLRSAAAFRAPATLCSTAVRPQVDLFLTTMVPRGTTGIVVASLGNDAGQVGAATVAFNGGSAPRVHPLRSKLLAVSLVLAAIAALPARSQSGDPIHKIRHVVIIMQENRSFDPYFGTFPGADGIPMSDGEPAVCVPDPSRATAYAVSRSRRPQRRGPHDANPAPPTSTPEKWTDS